MFSQYTTAIMFQVSTWGGWSVPSVSGASSRNRTIIQTTVNGGVPCPTLVEHTCKLMCRCRCTWIFSFIGESHFVRRWPLIQMTQREGLAHIYYVPRWRHSSLSFVTKYMRMSILFVIKIVKAYKHPLFFVMHEVQFD